MSDTKDPADDLDDEPSAVDSAIRAAFQSQQSQAGHSILAELPGDMPRVLLRDVPDEKTPMLAPASSEDVSVPSRYQIVGEIARGGVGAIYKVRDTDLGRDLAWKVLQTRHAARPDLVQRFVEEAQIGGQLQHPGIVPVYDLGLQEDRRPYISMKLVKGTTLSSQLSDRSDSHEDRERFLRLFGKICETMAYAHARGVIHRDLKPANVMVGSFGEVQIVDWGFAKVLGRGGVEDEKRAKREHKEMTIVETVRSGSDGSQSMAGSVFGTPAYMPPEQALGQTDQLNERTDVFALGSILCEILTGAPAYVEGEDRLVIQAARGALDEAHGRLERCGAATDLIKLATRCLSADRRGRPADAGQLEKLFAGVLERRENRRRAGEIETARAHARAEEALRARKKTRILATAGCAALLLAALGFHWAQRSIEERERQTTRLVGAALDEASQLGLEARGASTFVAATWDQALDAAQRAVDLAAREGADAATRERAEKRIAELEAARDAAKRRTERSAAEGQLRRAVATYRIRADSVNVYDAEQVRAEFVAALAAYGIDLDEAGPEAVVEAMTTSEAPVALRLAMDYLRLYLPRDAERRAKLDLVLARADGDAWRARLRAVTGDLDATLKLMRAPGVSERPSEDVQLLAYAIEAFAKGTAEEELAARREAARFVQAARAARPDDGWLSQTMAGLSLVGPEKGEEEGYWEGIEAACLHARDQLGDDPLMRYVLAVARFRAGKEDDALVVLRALHAEREDMPFVAERLAIHLAIRAERLLSEGQEAEARPYCEEATKVAPESAIAWSVLGNVYAAEERQEAAFDAWTKALSFDSDSYRTHRIISTGWLNAAKERKSDRYWEQGVALVRRMIELAETPAEQGLARAILGDFLYAWAKYDEACVAYGEGLELLPPSGLLCYLYGRALKEAGRSGEALEQFEQGIGLAREDLGDPARAPDALHRLRSLYASHSDLLWKLGRKDDTLDDARALLEVGADSGEHQFTAAVLFLRAGALEEALAASDAAQALIQREGGTTTAYFHEGRGAIFRALAKRDEDPELYRKAAAEYRTARERESTTAQANLIQVLILAGDVDEARDELGVLTGSDPTGLQGLASLGGIQGVASAEGADAITIEIWRAYLRREEFTGDARASMLSKLALLLAAAPDAELRRPAEALVLAQEAVELAEQDEIRKVARGTLGVAYYRVGRFEDAVKVLHEIVVGKRAAIYLAHYLAMAYWQTGAKERARALFAESEAGVEDPESAAKDRMLQASRAETAALLE